MQNKLQVREKICELQKKEAVTLFFTILHSFWTRFLVFKEMTVCFLFGLWCMKIDIF